MPNVDPNAVILTGENPFIRLSATDGSPNTTEASFWRITFSPGGPGHVLYLKSELTEGQLRIYSDNIAMTRWLQSTVQGMLNAETADLSRFPSLMRCSRRVATRGTPGPNASKLARMPSRSPGITSASPCWCIPSPMTRRRGATACAPFSCQPLGLG